MKGCPLGLLSGDHMQPGGRPRFAWRADQHVPHDDPELSMLLTLVPPAEVSGRPGGGHSKVR